MKKALRILGIAALAVGVFAYPLAYAVDRASGLDVVVVQAADPASVETNRGLWELNGGEKSEVAGIYGTPSKEIERIVFASEADLLRPKEDPALTLFLKRDGNKEIQSQTLWYFALLGTMGGLAGGGLLFWIGSRGKASEAPTA